MQKYAKKTNYPKIFCFMYPNYHLVSELKLQWTALPRLCNVSPPCLLRVFYVFSP